MPSPCPECRLTKRKVYLNIDKAREEARQIAIANEQTQAIYKESKAAVNFIDAASAIARGYDIIEMVSKHP